MKKEADKGLKVGNFIKKPFNDRWFVLDNVDRRLYYYEKQNSDVPNGFLDLAKVSRLAKTGKNDTEFLVEVVDDVLGAKVYTLQAPSSAQMELWIKALTIVKDSAKPKAKAVSTPSADQSSPTSSTPSTVLPVTTNSGISVASSTPYATTTSFKEALQPKPSTSVSPSNTPPNVSPSSATLPKRTTTSSPSANQAPNSVELPNSAPGRKFLGAQRSSMHPSSKTALHSTSVADRVANFEPNGTKSTPKDRWSVAKMPSSDRSSMSSPVTIPSDPAITGTVVLEKATESRIPAPLAPSSLNSSTPSLDTSTRSSLDSFPPPSLPSTSPDSTESLPTEEKQTEIVDTFKIGESHHLFRSSLSSLAPQHLGSLLSDADHVESSVPLVKNVNEGASLKLSSGGYRLAPLVPSPLALLEEGIQRSFSKSTQAELTGTYHQNNNDDDILVVKTPEEFVQHLRRFREQPLQEIRIRLGIWRLIGANGCLAAQVDDHVTNTSPSSPNEQDDDPSFTWQLPGFLVIQWISFDHWRVSQREPAAFDEIKWDLASVGKKLSHMDAFIAIPRQAVLYHLYAVVSKIMHHTQSVRSAFETPLEQQSDTLSADKLLQNLVRSDLCTRIAAVLFDGFNDWSLLRKFHIWDFIYDAALDRSGLRTFASLNLPLTVKDIAAATQDSNIRFRNFVISAMNSRQLFAWMTELLHNQAEVSDYYDDISLVKQVPSMVLGALAPLSELNLELSWEKGAPS